MRRSVGALTVCVIAASGCSSGGGDPVSVSGQVATPTVAATTTREPTAVTSATVAPTVRPASTPALPEFTKRLGSGWMQVDPGFEGWAMTHSEDKGFVAVADDNRVWRSTDGLVWEVANNGLPLELRTLRGLTAGGPGFVLIDNEHNELAAQVNTAVWVSVDGDVWERLADDTLPAADEACCLSSVVSSPLGVLITTSTLTSPKRWFSVDGLTWDLQTARPAFDTAAGGPGGFLAVTNNGSVYASADGASFGAVLSAETPLSWRVLAGPVSVVAGVDEERRPRILSSASGRQGTWREAEVYASVSGDRLQLEGLSHDSRLGYFATYADYRSTLR